MTISRANPGGWVANDKLTSPEINTIDINTTKAIDKNGDSVPGTIEIASGGVISLKAGGSLLSEPLSIIELDTVSAFIANVTYVNGEEITANTQLNSLNSCDLQGTVLLSGTTSVTGNATFTGNSTFNTNAPFFNAGLILAGGGFSAFSGTTAGFASGSTTTFFNGSTINFQNSAIVTLQGTNKINLTSRSLTRAQPYSFRPYANSIAPTTLYWLQDSVTRNWQTVFDAQSQAEARCELEIPHNCTLTAVRIYFQAPAAHVGFPTNMPAAYVRSKAISTGTVVDIASASKIAANYSSIIGNYNSVVDSILVSGMSAAVDRVSKNYFIDVIGENGTNALKGFQILGWNATYTVTEYDDG